MTALTPDAKARQKTARARAYTIREGMRNYIATLAAVHAAWVEEDWRTLGYQTWQAYVDAEFGEERVQLPTDLRRKAVEELRLAGMSTRALADTLGVDRNTVKRDLDKVGALHPPAEVRGADGKTYRPARSPLVEAMTGAIEDAEKRAETPGVAAPAEGADARPASSRATSTAPEGGPTQPSSGAPTTDHLASVAVAGPGEPVGDVQPSPATGGEPATSPAGSPCEKCGINIGAGPAADGFMQCSHCDPDGEHVADADGICRLCTAIATVPDAYLALVVAEGRNGLYLKCSTCNQLVAHLLPGEQLPLVLVEAHRHDCVPA